MTPYNEHKADVLKRLATSRQSGLTSEEAQARLTQHGPNALAASKPLPAWRQFLATLKEPLVIILFIAVLLAWASAGYDFFVRHDPSHGMAAVYESIAILLLIFVNAGLSFWQAKSAQKSLDALKVMADHHAKVLRDGDWLTVPATELVPGDIVSVKTGDFIEADVRWLHVAELQTNEAHLTGEAEPVQKQTHALGADVQIGDRTNMGFSGATVTHGNGLGVVVATGMQTELGKIATLLDQVKDKKTPIERTIARLTTKLMMVAMVMVAFTLLVELLKAYQQTGSLSF